MSDQEQLLAAQMAAVSAVKSTEIVEAAASAGQLNTYQTKLDAAADRVLETRKTLQMLQAYEVTPELAFDIDKDLDASGVEIPPVDGLEQVQGVECLGVSLLPKDYLFTRLVGCENFLSDFFKNSRAIVQRIGSNFKDAYVLFAESQESLEKSLAILDNLVDTYPEFGSSNSFILEHRLYNLFKVNGKVDQKWVENLTKLSRTVGALSGNYYLNAQSHLQTVYSYFGGFSGVTQMEADERILLMPISIPSIPFKECTYPNARFASPNVVAKQSVELMGGAYFYDVRQKGVKKEASSIDEVKDFLIRFTEFDRTGFDKSAEYTLKEVGFEIDALSSKEIKAVVKQLRDINKEWAKIFEGGEKFKMNDNDYNDISKSILSSELDEDTKILLSKWFSSIVMKNQQELLTIRAQVSSYLTLITNGLIDVCNNSIKVNTP